MDIFIKEIKSKRDLRKFIKFPFKLYKNCPQWVPPIFFDELNTFTPKKIPLLNIVNADFGLLIKTVSLQEE